MKKMMFSIGAATVMTALQAATAFAGFVPRSAPTPVPEPTTLMLVAVGLGGAAVVDRFRKRNKK